MMKFARPEKYCLAVSLALAVLLAAYPAAAGPEEDYRTGYDFFDKKGDVPSAIIHLKKAADVGYAPAQAMLGYIYDYSEMDSEAVEMYKKAAAQGNADGEHGLGLMYSKGEGIERDYAEALRLVTSAAGKEHYGAVLKMISIYKNGEFGAAKDPEKAAYWEAKKKALDEEREEQRKREKEKLEKERKGEGASAK